MIGLPYPKLMNSNNDVDQAAALLMCSVERARSLGIPEDRWVFPHAGADCHEHPFVSNRWSLADTPAIRAGGRTVLELAGVGMDDIEVVDLYSCFPSAVQLGAAALGLDLDRQLTRTGGLSFAGGPWNNYVMHAIATVMADLRDRPGAKGLVWANGGYVTKHSFGVYATEPAAGRLPPRVAAGRGGRRSGKGLRRAGRRGRSGGRRGLHGHARPRGPAGDRHRRVPPGRRTPSVGDDERGGRSCGALRGRVGRPLRHPRRRRRAARLTADEEEPHGWQSRSSSTATPATTTRSRSSSRPATPSCSG